MPEAVTLSSPFGAVTGTPRWVVASLVLERGYTSSGGTITSVPSQSRIKVALIGENGHRKSHQWAASVADAFIVALNKANLNPATGGKSLNTRVIERLIADGVIDGTVSGSVD